MLDIDTEEMVINKSFRISYDNPDYDELQKDFKLINNLVLEGFHLSRIGGGTNVLIVALEKRTFKNNIYKNNIKE